MSRRSFRPAPYRPRRLNSDVLALLMLAKTRDTDAMLAYCEVIDDLDMVLCCLALLATDVDLTSLDSDRLRTEAFQLV